jgi:hypothetical protein
MEERVAEPFTVPPAEPPPLEDPGCPVSVRPSVLCGMLRRLRPVEGTTTILVQPGEYVLPDTVVARVQPPGRLHLMNVAAALGVPPRRLPRYTRVQAGQDVEQGELLAEYRGPLGLGRRQCHATVAGTVAWISTESGCIAIVEPVPPAEIRAHLGGKVVATPPGEGVIIEGPALAVLGVAGCGGTAQGRLLLAAELAEVPQRASGMLVALARPVTYYDTVHVAETGARGLLAPALVPDAAGPLLAALRRCIGRAGLTAGRSVAAAAPLPQDFCLVLTEGFGHLDMPPGVLELLRKFDGQVASLTAEPPQPELLLPLEVIPDLPGPRGIRPGALVRLTAPAYLGAQATVVQSSGLLRRLPAGLREPAALVQLPDESQQWHGLANLELLRE